MHISIEWLFGKKRADRTLRSLDYEAVAPEQAHACLGGFKEYKPPIYEKENFINSEIEASKLIDHL